ncbi:MAG: ATP-dependent DNA helicase RecG, partial [Oscillospiraceae bacterium]
MSFSLNDSIKKLSGVGQARAALYEKLGVDTVYSLLRFYPRTYIDFSHKVDIANIVPEEVNVIKATVIKKMNEARIRKGLSIFKVVVADTTGTVTIVIFNNVYMFEAFKEGEEYILSGKISVQNGKKEMPSPTFISANEPLSFLPIYHLTQGLSNKMVQANVKQAMLLWGDTLDDVIPLSVKIKNNLCQYRYALENIHFPKDETALKISRDRLVFEELLILQLGLLQLKARNRQTTGNIINSVDMTPFYSSLPFKLTQGQLFAIDDALCDMQKET